MSDAAADSAQTPTGMDWEARFREGHTPWERPGLHPAFLQWREAGTFADVKRIIIPGCGRAPELAAFAQMGLDAAGTDLSETALNYQRNKLKENNLSAVLIPGDSLAYAPDAPFDAVYEQTFLCAISPKLRGDYERAVHRWLRPGGRLFALFMQKEEPGGPPYGCSIAAMHDLFPGDRWTWPEPPYPAFPHPSLSGKPELAVILTRR